MGKNFTEALFSGSPFIKWTLSPIFLLFLIGMPFLIPAWTIQTTTLMAAVEAIVLSLLLSFWIRPIATVCARVVTGMVFCGYVGYVGYVADMLLNSDKPFALPSHRGEANAFNALLGLIVIGLPCLVYTIRGSFTKKRSSID